MGGPFKKALKDTKPEIEAFPKTKVKSHLVNSRLIFSGQCHSPREQMFGLIVSLL